MIDLLTHGFGEFLYGDAEEVSLVSAAKALLRHGVTAFAPSFVSKSTAELLPLLERLAALPTGPGARVLGFHAEGPCLAHSGAHADDNLQLPSADLAERMLAAADGRLAFVTLAPELPGADAFISRLRAAGVGLHLGHAGTTPDQVPAVCDAGISAVTHMYDVMFPATVSEPGLYPLSLADALLAEPRLCLGIICDGVHVVPQQLRLLAQLPPDRVFLETDSMKFTGLPPGRFELDPGLWVNTTTDRGARLDGGALAGSTITSDAGLRNFLRLASADPVRAAAAASLNPARLAGMADDAGSIEPGKLADLVVFDTDWQPVATYVSGHRLWAANAEE
jgi:N-acetylglucosamine-6-phosphate deacetylase